jgi:NAD(P)-dependent dehydrogenase (short-subunit alcohol dehydrogenase family)
MEQPVAMLKEALWGITHGLATEGAHKCVRVNAVSLGQVPETIVSQQQGRLWPIETGSMHEQIVEGASRGILQGRSQTAAEIAAQPSFWRRSGQRYHRAVAERGRRNGLLLNLSNCLTPRRTMGALAVTSDSAMPSTRIPKELNP